MSDSFSRFIGAWDLPMNAADIVADGTVQRFRGGGDKPGTRLRFYVLRAFPIPHGFAGRFSGGEVSFEFWRDPAARAIDWSEWGEICASRRTMRQVIEQVHHKVLAEARSKAGKLLGVAKPPNPHHAFFVRDCIKPVGGMRQLRDRLLVPLQRDGITHNLQFIDPDGTTRFLSGGRIKGCFFQIGSPSGVIVLSDSLAAAIAAHELTGWAAATSFTTKNLSDVARKIWIENDLAILIVIVVAGENLDAAIRAATGVNGWIAHPDFTDAQPAANLLKAVPEDGSR